ncbi:helicase HerA-like domain-containing protein [Arvimicrobium flavum]|uniref:helicase HerA-like domain-containing protein n=1 Tax=Arvimicrobium flavum TaxID=3393320 RepID=UPI00237C4828|nr:helicase HerA-like domain-containing protein [Mesorhizobium shangrilense]
MTGAAITIGVTKDGRGISLPLRLANRHGLVTGATGSGKTRTLQVMVEQLSAAGVPVFAADVKGDLSGLGSPGVANGPPAARAAALGRIWAPEAFPVAFWDLFDLHGLPIRTSVQDMGALLLSTMLGLNETQAGAMAIAFRIADERYEWMLTLNDLRWTLNDMLEDRESVCRQYGNITASSISAIQRGILALEAQGGDRLFGEPPFDISDFMRVAPDGRGIINLLHADHLMESPKTYAVFLLWLLTELFRRLPEAGDLEKPKIAFFFDEAHLLFRDAPPALLQQIERLVRLVRSKGVGVFFVTQSPADVPDVVLEQLGTRVLHGMRAHTAKSMRQVRAAADTLRPNKGVVDARAELPALATGEALVSVFGDDGAPAPVEKVAVLPPTSSMEPISELERRTAIEGTELRTKYAAGLSDNAAASQFIRRQKIARGIDPGPEVAPGDDWQPGDYAKFLPNITPVARREPRAKRRDLVMALVCGAVAVGCFWWTGLV